MIKQIAYRNIFFFLIALFILNLCVGFYKSVKNVGDFKASSVNYTIQDKDSDREAHRIANDLMALHHH